MLPAPPIVVTHVEMGQNLVVGFMAQTPARMKNWYRNHLTVCPTHILDIGRGLPRYCGGSTQMQYGHPF